MNNDIFSRVDEYIENNFTRPDPILEQAVANIAKAGMPAHSISANQGKFLHLLAKLCGAKKILEVGTLGGYSTIWMARALPESGKLISLELNPLHSSIAQQNILSAGLQNKVEIKTGVAIDLLSQMKEKNEGPFDMIFIDADKPLYVEYFQWALQLSRKGTLIIADNVIRKGEILQENSDDPSVPGVKRFIEFLYDCKDVDSTVLQMMGVKGHDGMSVSVVN